MSDNSLDNYNNNNEEEGREEERSGGAGAGGDLPLPLQLELEDNPLALPRPSLIPQLQAPVDVSRGLGDASVVANYNQVMGQLLDFWRQRLSEELLNVSLQDLVEEEREWRSRMGLDDLDEDEEDEEEEDQFDQGEARPGSSRMPSSLPTPTPMPSQSQLTSSQESEDASGEVEPSTIAETEVAVEGEEEEEVRSECSECRKFFPSL